MKATAQAAPPPPPAPAPAAEFASDTTALDAEDVTEAPAPPAPPPKRLPKEAERASPVIRQIERDEDLSLRDWLKSIGTDGAFKIAVSRESPKTAIVNGQPREVKGFLHTYEEFIGEDDIQRDFGGGTFNLKISKRGEEGGSYKYVKHRTITIAGDPKVPGTAPPAAPAASVAPGGENPSVVKAAMDMMKDQLDRLSAPAEPRGIDPAMQMVVEQMRQAVADAKAEAAETRRELAALRNKPPEDTVKDGILNTLLRGESSRIAALEAKHDSEIRMIREGHTQELARIQDRHDRTVEAMRQDHANALATIKASYEREIAAMRSTSDVMAIASKTTADVTTATLNAENRRLEAENGNLHREIKELREKKDKPFLEQLKDIQAIKETMGVGDGDDAGSTLAKIAEMVPGAIEAVGALIQQRAGGAPAAQAQVAVQAQPARPKIYRDRAGQRVAMVQGPQGPQLVPVKRKPAVVTKEDGTQLEAPEVDPAQIAMLVPYLEQAFKNKTEPVLVAQSGQSTVPPAVLAWIRDNDTEAVSGIDLFMTKVVKLPGTSPLATQAGKNWLRAVGKHLIGGE